MHLNLIITIQSQKVLENWYYAKSKTFFNSGSNVSMIKRSAFPKGVITKLLGDIKLVRTLAGHPKMQEVVMLQHLRLPKFDKNKRIKQQKILVFENESIKYNIILRINLLSKTRFKSNYSEGNMEWFD